MKYISWLWRNSCGIRWNTVVRIIAGIIQVVLSLLMVWLSKRFIDETIRTGTADDVLRMVELLVLTVVGGVILRQSCSRATNCTRVTCPRAWPRT